MKAQNIINQVNSAMPYHFGTGFLCGFLSQIFQINANGGGDPATFALSGCFGIIASAGLQALALSRYTNGMPPTAP